MSGHFLFNVKSEPRKNNLKVNPHNYSILNIFLSLVEGMICALMVYLFWNVLGVLYIHLPQAAGKRCRMLQLLICRTGAKKKKKTRGILGILTQYKLDCCKILVKK